jgi:hypothetical protein
MHVSPNRRTFIFKYYTPLIFAVDQVMPATGFSTRQQHKYNRYQKRDFQN